MIRTPQDVFMVHPLPDRLKLGKNNTRAHVIHRRSLSPAHAQSLAQALEDEKRSDSWCGVEGINRDHGFLFSPSALAALFLSLEGGSPSFAFPSSSLPRRIFPSRNTGYVFPPIFYNSCMVIFYYHEIMGGYLRGCRVEIHSVFY